MSKNYVMFDVADSRAEAIAEAIGNKTCKKILSLLAEKEMSETDIAKNLSIPANTAHYNVQKLVSAGLIEPSKGFFWSAKGKKVQTYRLSNKRIVISPKESFRGVLSAMVTTGIVAILIKTFSRPKEIYSASSVGDSYVTDTAMMKVAESSASYTQTVNDAVISSSSGLGAWSWFLLGAWTALLIFVVIQIWREHSQK